MTTSAGLATPDDLGPAADALAARFGGHGLQTPPGLIHHSDKDSHYTSLTFGQRCDAAAIRPSTGRTGSVGIVVPGGNYRALLAPLS
ncbi:hypothetical protein [Streptomyces hebeiensis]